MSFPYRLGFLGLDMQMRGPNYYAQLGVNRSSNPLEIKRAYKKLSLQLHPDKNPSPDASSQFDAIKQAHDVLMDMELREVYNKFGREGVRNSQRFDEMKYLMGVAIYYMSFGMVAFMLTLGKKNSEARNWTFTGLLVMMVVEVTIMTSQTNPLPEWLFPTMTEYDAVWLLKSLFPAFMNGCRLLGAFQYVDLEAQTRQLLRSLQEQNKDVLLVLRDVQIGIQTIQTHGAGSAAPRIAPDGAAGHGPPLRATPTGKLRELQDRLQSSNAGVSQAVSQLKTDTGKSSNMGFYMMIAGYIVISYIFNK